MVPHRDDVDALAGREPGEDGDDPYADIDISALPEWWRKGIEEHRAYGLRPYRPPRFEDDTIYPSLEADLEAEFDITLTLVCYDIETGVWSVVVDGEHIAELERERSPEGYSVIRTTGPAFRELIENAVEQ